MFYVHNFSLVDLEIWPHRDITMSRHSECDSYSNRRSGRFTVKSDIKDEIHSDSGDHLRVITCQAERNHDWCKGTGGDTESQLEISGLLNVSSSVSYWEK